MAVILSCGSGADQRGPRPPPPRSGHPAGRRATRCRTIRGMAPPDDAPQLGTLTWLPAHQHLDLLGEPVAAAVPDLSGPVWVASIDEDAADTAAFTDVYGVPPAASANCVVVAARRAGETTMAACLVLATSRADVNGLVRRHLGARKASFAPQDVAVAESGMAYGGVTPGRLPDGGAGVVGAPGGAGGVVVIGRGPPRGGARGPRRGPAA